jgi:hypothetical protein
MTIQRCEGTSTRLNLTVHEVPSPSTYTPYSLYCLTLHEFPWHPPFSHWDHTHFLGKGHALASVQFMQLRPKRSFHKCLIVPYSLELHHIECSRDYHICNWVPAKPTDLVVNHHSVCVIDFRIPLENFL